MEITETIRCHGHPNVRGLHKSTFEITKETELSLSGDCIIAIGADKGAADLSSEFRTVLATDGSKLLTHLQIEDIEATVVSEGTRGITLSHSTDLVWRRSTFLCPRTVGIYSDHVACQLPRELIEELKKGKEMVVTLTVQCGEPQ
ncbi:MAG TPA: DUF371 domain-containing protein [Methanocorpusculum sp.]|nr:DUF371 domain-containing protein [Methanocorpusculum sp.]